MEVVTAHQATTHRSRPSGCPAGCNTWGHCATPMRCWSRWRQPTHRDPLDRRLAGQAELEDLALITADPQLSAFPSQTL